MSELDKIKECLDFFCRRCNEQGFYSPPLQPIVKEAYEAIAALRSEPVATVRRKEDDSLEFTPLCDFYVVNGMKLYAAPSRKTAKVVPVHSKSQYRRVAAQGGNPVLSRETDQRSEAAQVSAADGNDAASQGRCEQSSDHPTEPALSAEQIESARRILLSHYGFNNETDLQRRGNINAICDMALSSLTANSDLQSWQDELINARKDAMTARDEGIEAVLNDEALHLSDRQRSRVRNLKGQP